MFPSSCRSERGSAVLEFITYVLLGQMLLFGGSIVLSKSLSDKVAHQLAAVNAATANATPDGCAGPLVCAEITFGGQTFRGLSYAG